MTKKQIADALAELERMTLEVRESTIEVTVADIDPREEVPHSEKPGVYAILSPHGEALYVGKSEVSVGSRCWSGLIPDEDGSGVTWAVSRPDIPKPEKMAVFPVSHRNRRLVAALEAILIENLNPPMNIQGRIPQSRNLKA